jgi:MFS family permease
LSLPLVLLRDRSFRLLWSAHVVSSFGDALTALALLLTAQRLTGSTAAVAATAIAIALPQLAVGLLAGVMVDRWNRRRVMIASDVIRAALVLGFLTVGTADHLWLLYALAFAQSAVGTFFNPARAALLAELLPAARLLPANSLSDTSRVVAGVAGTGAAGVLASVSSSLSVVFVVDALTFVASAVLIALIRDRIPERRNTNHSRVVAELGAGLRLVFGSRILLGVVTAGAIAMFGLAAVNVVLVPFIVEDLAASEAWFGPLEAAQVAAMVITGGLVAAFSSRLRPTQLITAGAVGLGASITAIAACGAAWQLVIPCFAAGWFVAPVQSAVTTLLQTSVSPQLRGRVQASFATLVSAASITSMAAVGSVAAVIGTRAVFLLAGLIVAAAGALSLAAFRSAGSPAPTAALEPL